MQNAIQEYYSTLNNTMNPNEAKYKGNNFMEQLMNGVSGTASAI